MTLIPHSTTEWSPMVGRYQYRIGERSPGRVLCLWRKEHNPAFYAGYQIKTIPLGTRIADEWLCQAQSLTPACDAFWN
jgi:hypothetical protein